MFHILGFLFIIIIAVLLIGVGILTTLLRTIFGWGKRSSAPHSDGYSHTRNRSQSPTSEEEVQAEEGETRYRHKKVFSADEGEYVDFEEIKE